MEPHILKSFRGCGWIEVICGSMFSGKTEELIRRLRRAQFARMRVEIFKPAVDTRFAEDGIISHDERVVPSTPVDSASQILLMASDADVIGIDEAQFFGSELPEVAVQLARDGKRVIVAGLDQDFLGEPFDPMPQLMAVAEFVTKLHAICVVCGAPANHSQRLTAGKERVLLGATDKYEPRCRACFDPQEATRTKEDSESGTDDSATTQSEEELIYTEQQTADGPED